MITILYIGLAGCILFLVVVSIALITKSKSKTVAREEEAILNPETDLQTNSKDDAETRAYEEGTPIIRQNQTDKQISRPVSNSLVTLNYIAVFIILTLGFYFGISFIIEANKILSLFKIEGISNVNGTIYVAGFAIIGIVGLIALLFYNQARIIKILNNIKRSQDNSKNESEVNEE